ncbi:hypothetical protein ROB49_004647 [Enterobacter cloacae]|nr:hypothetical protein [Enterobacter cloacae]HAS1225534.1 hypothetical protein [Enterobacter cloacae]HDC4662513.1 hypothetical protein [Enterobacter cloacae]HDC4761302.1 hypothetical protein [Enterobacter cloacae]
MCEQVLNTGNIPVKGGITQGTVNTFNFIFDVRPAGKRATKAGQGQICTVREGNCHGNKNINPEAVNVR